MLLVQLRQDALHLGLVGRDEPTRFLHHVVRHPAARRNGQRVACAGPAQLEAVIRTQGLHVEDHGGIDHRGMVEYEGLDRSQVRGGERQAAAAAQGIENGASQSAAFTRIRTSAEFVEEH